MAAERRVISIDKTDRRRQPASRVRDREVVVPDLIRRTGPATTRSGGAGDDDEHAEAVGASTATVAAPLRAGVDLLREVAMGSVAGPAGAIRSTHRRTPARVPQ